MTIAFNFVKTIKKLELIYNFFLRLFSAGIYIASFFNEKAKLWADGRKNIFEKLELAIGDSKKVIWMHCASLGEFEQGRPVLEKLGETYPDKKILLTFFSPSGYEIRKNYSGANWIFYLPLDTKKNVARFIKIVHPELAIFVKYEYWYNYLKTLHEEQITCILISALFTESKIFFQWYGGLHRKMINWFSHIFVQNEESKNLLSKIIDTKKITVAGDTRFDRVFQIANDFKSIEAIEKFVLNKKIIVAGSTWPDDEKNLKSILNSIDDKIFLIIAPHEINPEHIEFLKSLFPLHILYSDLEILIKNNQLLPQDKNVLIINNIGMLSRLYHYSTISYIGGGFNKSGIHNTLEAAVYGKPVIFGPNYEKFSEAIQLVKNKGGYSYKNNNELFTIIGRLLNNMEQLKESGNAARNYVKENTGATQKIIDWIKRNAS